LKESSGPTTAVKPLRRRSRSPPLSPPHSIPDQPQPPATCPLPLTLYSSNFTLAPGAAVPFDLHAFFGPKQRDLLDSTYYSAYPLWYAKTLVYSSGPCGYITFSWLITVLCGILGFFHMIFRDWGLGIIGLVCLVRLLLHPITKKAQINMMSHGQDGSRNRTPQKEIWRQQRRTEQGHDERLQGTGHDAHPWLSADVPANPHLDRPVERPAKHLRAAPGRLSALGTRPSHLDLRPLAPRCPDHLFPSRFRFSVSFTSPR